MPSDRFFERILPRLSAGRGVEAPRY
jgi:hypothetical protein